MWDTRYLDDGNEARGNAATEADLWKRIERYIDELEALDRAERARIADELRKLTEAINEADDDEYL